VIARHWKGTVKPGRAEDYVAHLREQTLPTLASIAGFRGAQILRREVPEGTEFRIVTEWESLEAIRAFAGDRVEEAVVPAAAQVLMVDYDRTVTHYEVVGRFPSPS
jgi:heme-degrading monooxygenase HmoA